MGLCGGCHGCLLDRRGASSGRSSRSPRWRQCRCRCRTRRSCKRRGSSRELGLRGNRDGIGGGLAGRNATSGRTPGWQYVARSSCRRRASEIFLLGCLQLRQQSLPLRVQTRGGAWCGRRSSSRWRQGRCRCWRRWRRWTARGSARSGCWCCGGTQSRTSCCGASSCSRCRRRDCGGFRRYCCCSRRCCSRWCGASCACTCCCSRRGRLAARRLRCCSRRLRRRASDGGRSSCSG